MLTPTKLHEALDLIRDVNRASANLVEAKDTTSEQTLLWMLDRRDEALQTRILEVIRTEVTVHLHAEINAKRAKLHALDVVLTDADIATHVKEDQARRAKWEADRLTREAEETKKKVSA